MTEKEKNNFNRQKDGGLDPTVYGGVFGGNSSEQIVEHIKTDAERVEQHGDVYIIYGKDRPSDRTSGYGGTGDQKSHSLDIVVGKTTDEFDPDQPERRFVNPDFESDAVRIYLSQKSDVDENFKISGDRTESVGKSCVGIKADHIRIVSREAIKIVTGTDSKNSRGGDINKRSGVEIIADNNVEKLQPMPLGRNVSEAFVEIVDSMNKLSSILENLVQIQSVYISELNAHVHFSPFFGQPTTPSQQALSSGLVAVSRMVSETSSALSQLKINLASIQMQFLSPCGEKFIQSELNKAN